MENLIEKNGSQKKVLSVRNTLIILQIIFIAFMLVAEWTSASDKIRLFFFLFDLSDWGKILFYIPLVYVLHVTIIKTNKYYYYGLAVYIMFFVLETLTMATLISDKLELNTAGNLIEFNIALKAVELIVIGSVSYIYYNILEKKEIK